MTRRSFFARLAGVVTATVVGYHTPPLTFRGVPLVWDANMPTGMIVGLAPPHGLGTIGGINRATYSFWRAQMPPGRINYSNLDAAFKSLTNGLERVHSL